MRLIYSGLVLVSLMLRAYGALEVTATAMAQMELSTLHCEITPQLFTTEWQTKDASGGYERDGSGDCNLKFVLNDGTTVRGKAQITTRPDGKVWARYLFTPEREVTLNTLCVSFHLSGEEWIGGRWEGTGASGALPQEYGKLTLARRKEQKFTLLNPDGSQRIGLSFPKPTEIMLQDNRQWGNSLSLRVGDVFKRTYKGGDEVVVEFILETQAPLKLYWDEPIELNANDEWIALKPEVDIVAGSALDFSRISGLDAPAGKHGWVVSKGGNFQFEKLPGVAQRFYGVNLCFTANYLQPEEAAQLVERLARIGYNALRIHHHDGGLVEGAADGTTINPAQMALMDGLMAACISNGIYVTTDLFVSRQVPWRTVGIERNGKISQREFKALACIHEGAFDNLKKFTRQFLTHVNPYTGRSYAREPALAWLALINEGNLGNFVSEMQSIPEWSEAWRTWLVERQAREPALYRDIPNTLPTGYNNATRHTAAFSLFLQEVDERFTRRMKEFLRDELGCPALISNRSSWTNRAVDQATRHRCYDFVDDHFYVDHPQFLEHRWRLPSRCSNFNPLRNSAMGAQNIAFTRLLDQPFTVTEYNYSGPGRFRGVGGIVTGTMAALQDWDGLWRFAFSHSRDGIISAQGSAMGYFDMCGDPLSLAAERASIALFLRRDLEPLKRTGALVLPEEKITAMRETIPMNRAEWPWLAWYARIGTLVAPQAPAGTTTIGSYPEVYALPGEAARQALEQGGGGTLTVGDGAVTVDRESGTFILKSARTCGGFTEAGSVAAGDLTFDVGETAATVWVSSLEEKPIREASRLLLTHLTDVQNSGIRYAQRSRKVLLKWGKLPHIVRNGKAQARLTLKSKGAFKVYALSQGGRRIGEVATRWEGGQLCFTAAVDGQPGTATMLYEVVDASGGD